MQKCPYLGPEEHKPAFTSGEIYCYSHLNPAKKLIDNKEKTLIKEKGYTFPSNVPCYDDFSICPFSNPNISTQKSSSNDYHNCPYCDKELPQIGRSIDRCPKCGSYL